MAEKLEELHLADLHAQAAKLGIPRYRMLRRDRLVAEIQDRNGEPPAADPGSCATRPRR